jgi:3-isopropylmalate/(R)-2-methylmalate dehydratase large subunit
VPPDGDARYAREINIDVSALEPQIARPHEPDNVVALRATAGTPVDMVFIGTCTGGRVSDFHQVLGEIDAAEGIAPGVMLVLTPASREVYLEITRDGTLEKLTPHGCGNHDARVRRMLWNHRRDPGDGMTIVSTAKSQLQGTHGNATASIYLASPAACAAAAVTGVLTSPRVRI